MKNIIILIISLFVCGPVFSQWMQPTCDPIYFNPLVGLWGFNGNGIDNGPNNTDGTLNNIDFDYNKCGGLGEAAKFNGINSYVDVPNSFHPTDFNNVIYSIWLKPFVNDKNQTILHIGSLEDSNQVSIMLWEGGNLGIKLKGLEFHSHYILPINQWSHLTVTKDSSIRFWVNRYLVDSVGYSTSLNLTNTDIRIGGDLDTLNNNYFNGMMDNVGIFTSIPCWENVYAIWWGGPVSNKSQVNQKIKLYPNPTNDFITVEGSGNIQITNSFGNVVFNGFIKEDMTIKVSDWNKGIYFVKFNQVITKIQIY